MRLDLILVEKKIVKTRSQAKIYIQRGDVFVNGVPQFKASYQVEDHDQIELNSEVYVGRGAFKLKAAIEKFNLEVKNKIAIDIGASTGGFTEILLSYDVKKVYAVDVGTNQLDACLRINEKVISFEGQDIRTLKKLPDRVELGVMDLSFISVSQVVESVTSLFQNNGEIIALIKPQFEVGKDLIPKDGVVKKEEYQKMALTKGIDSFKNAGWTLIDTMESPLKGKSGNLEYLVHFKLES